MWFGNKGNDNDVAVSTRVRIARNLSGYPFPGRLSAEQEKRSAQKLQKYTRERNGRSMIFQNSARLSVKALLTSTL